LRRNINIFKPNTPTIGLNNTDDEISIPSNVLVDTLNMEADRNGVKTRPGYVTYSTSGLPSASVDGAFVFKESTGNVTLLVQSNGQLYKETTTGLFSSINAGMTADYPADFASLVDLAIMGNGRDEMIKYDGTAVYNLGISAPTTGPTAAVGAAGSLTGDYIYKVTFVSAKGGESNAGTPSNTITTASDSVVLSNIPIGPTGDIAKRNIYRTETGGTVFFFLDVIGDNTTTTYNDDTTDVNLSVDVLPVGNDTPPPAGKFPTVYKQYLFVVDPAFPTRDYFSNQNFPEVFNRIEGTGNYMIVGLNDGQDIIGHKPLRAGFFIFKEFSTWPMMGNLPDDFKLSIMPISSTRGLYHRSIAYVDMGQGDMLIGLAHDGFFMFNGFTYQSISFQPQSGINVQDFIDGLDKNKLHKAWGINDTDRRQYRCAVTEAGSSYNNKEFVWDYRHNRVFIFDRPINVAVRHNNNILFGTSLSTGGMFQIGGTNDGGTAIQTVIEWPWWVVSDELVANFDRLNIDTTLQGNYSPTVQVFVDGDVSAFPLSLSGTNNWGSIAWATKKGKYRTKVPLQVVGSDYVNLRGSYFKVRITHNGLNEPYSIHSMALYYAKTNEPAGFEVDSSVNIGGMAT